MHRAERQEKLLGLFMAMSPNALRQVISAFAPDELFSLSFDELGRRAALKGDAAARLRDFKDWDGVSRMCERIQTSGIGIISMLDARYPYEGPDALADLPPVLFVKGDITRWTKRGLAVVGSREPTPYGRKAAYAIGAEAASRGVTLVSGMALGIDGEAHRGALENGGFTVAVMGCGLLNVYPPSHGELYERICASGVAVSQFLPTQEPDARFFPSRNQWIAYFSDGVVIVEGEVKSGARHTAEYAVRHQRRLYAVPGQIDNPKAALPNRLLCEGAMLVCSPSTPFGGGRPLQADLFRQNATSRAAEEKVSQSGSFDVNSLGLSKLALDLFDKIGTGVAGADELHRATSASLPDLNQALLELELTGIIRQEAGRRYRRA